MNITEFNSRLREEVNTYMCSGRNESAAFLAWYLKNFFRIEEQDAIDSVCDSRNDKGIDGIYVDEIGGEIYLFQSKFSPNDNREQGDNDLRNFVGARQWFESERSVGQLVASTASVELKSLVAQLEIADRISSGYSIYLQFVTNKMFDTNAKEFLNLPSNILEGFDLNVLFSKYTYIADEEIQISPVSLSLSNLSRIEYNLPSGIITKVYPIRANELLKLEGIRDRTLFYKNVRYGLGKTRVNKDIKKTILHASEHNNFFLYHNGITVVCDTLEEGPNYITISNYTIINGCQTMLTFYENRNQITDNIYILTKIIKLPSTTPLVQQITYFANNQNAISLRDLKSDDRVQKALQREFNGLFNCSILYRRKTGESKEGYDEVIEKDFAAQLIEAFYLGNPHNTHLKNKLFGDRYTQIFSRRINAQKVYLAYIVYNIVDQNAQHLVNEQIREYGLAKFCFAHLIGQILQKDEIGHQIYEDPTEYVTAHVETLKKSISKLWMLITPDIDAYIAEYTEQNNGFLDYKNVFKNAEFVRKLARRINSDHERIMVRHAEDSFSNIYTSFLDEESDSTTSYSQETADE